MRIMVFGSKSREIEFYIIGYYRNLSAMPLLYRPFFCRAPIRHHTQTGKTQDVVCRIASERIFLPSRHFYATATVPEFADGSVAQSAMVFHSAESVFCSLFLLVVIKYIVLIFLTPFSGLKKMCVEFVTACLTARLYSAATSKKYFSSLRLKIIPLFGPPLRYGLRCLEAEPFFNSRIRHNIRPED